MSALYLKDLVKTYPNGVQALKGINLTVEKGDFFGLLGPNGAGKSTTIGIISSLVNKTSGQVKLFDFDMDTHLEDAKRSIGLVPQEFNINIFEKVQSIVINQAGYYGIPRSVAAQRAEHYLKKLGLWEKRNEQARTLSGGMKRRLMIARGLVHNPKVLVLDEPTAGVDVELRYTMWEYLKEINAEGTTIILTTHYLEEAEQLCKNIAIIDKGTIITQKRTKDLVSSLQSETLIVEFKKPISSSLTVDDCTISKIDDTSLEFSYKIGMDLSKIFECIIKQGGEVLAIRPKTNRLEELFLQLTQSESKTEGRRK